ncbi:MAG: hypothetical protein J6W79_02955 [Alphaproteobacteria bacterium]|nr:hypothetical protein [Alphaproteobacteria bacterium]
MRENLTEGLKRNIYYELATHDVVETEGMHPVCGTFSCWQYTFGKYRIEKHWDYISMAEFNPSNNHFVYMNNVGWDDDYPTNTTFEIYVAAKNKANGKPYIDPYKMPAKETIKDSQKRFEKQMSEYAADFLPYDTPKDLRQKIITEMETILTSNLRLHYKGKNR